MWKNEKKHQNIQSDFSDVEHLRIRGAVSDIPADSAAGEFYCGYGGFAVSLLAAAVSGEEGAVLEKYLEGMGIWLSGGFSILSGIFLHQRNGGFWSI